MKMSSTTGLSKLIFFATTGQLLHQKDENIEGGMGVHWQELSSASEYESQTNIEIRLLVLSIFRLVKTAAPSELSLSCQMEQGQT